jgi:hypothetical protein
MMMEEDMQHEEGAKVRIVLTVRRYTELGKCVVPAF